MIRSAPLVEFYKPAFYFLTRCSPWSVLSVQGFWRIWRKPSQDPQRRTAERAVFCYFFFGLAVLSLASHHRGDLIFPLLPVASLVAGNAAAQRFHFPTAKSFFLPAASFVVIAIIATGAYYYRIRSHDPHVRATCRLRDAAGQIDAILKPGMRVEYVGTDYTLQFYLNTLRPFITAGEAVRLMAMPVKIYIVMHSTGHDAIKTSLTDLPVYVLFQSEDIVLVSNHLPSQT